MEEEELRKIKIRRMDWKNRRRKQHDGRVKVATYILFWERLAAKGLTKEG